MPFAQVRDVRLYYEVHGERNPGRTLVIVPGLGGHHGSWSPILPLLAAERRVLIFDNRGAGLSDRPPGPYTMEDFVGDLAALLDLVGEAFVDLYGESMGGMIAQQFVLAHPNRVNALILSCTSPGGPNSVRTDAATLRAMFETDRAEPEAPERSFAITYSEQFISANLELLITHSTSIAHLAAPPEAQRAQAAALRAHDVHDLLGNISQPTLVLHGTADRIIPVRNGELIAERIPHAELVLFEGAGHGLKVERRDEVAGAVLEFLARHSPAV